MSEWTPGPWRLAAYSFQGSTGPAEWGQARVEGPGLYIDVEGVASQIDANSRLIVKAPEMAELLNFILDNGYEPDATNADIRALLAEIKSQSVKS